MTIWDLDTPALLLDGPIADHNILQAAAFVADKPVRLRPHFKNHKCLTLARRQLAAGGCVGMTAAKLAEAEILVDGGITNVLVANQIVGPKKVERLAKLNQRAQVRVAVDSFENAAAIAQAATNAGATVGVLIEVDVGMGRCGLPPGAAVVRLAQRLLDLPGIRFDGLQAYEGHSIAIIDQSDRDASCRAALQQAIATRHALTEAGVPVAVLSSAGTGTYRVAGTLPGIDELQIGSYVTMDWSYAERSSGEFQPALTVLTTVISVTSDRFVLDVGVKGVGDEMGAPKLKNYPQFSIPRFLAEEHAVVQAPGHRLKVGDRVELIPSHCCTTCNLHRQLVVRDAEKVLDIWPIEASGALT